MTILVLSDSHGSEKKLIKAIENVPEADAIVFLGDGERDFGHALAHCDLYPYGAVRKEIYQVRGNCDRMSNEAVTLLADFDGIQTLITHGFDQSVKYGYGRLAAEAKHRGCRLALFGHTHRAGDAEVDGVALFNPGSIGSGSYGIIQVEDGRLSFSWHLV